MKKLLIAVMLLTMVGCAPSVYTKSADDQAGLTWIKYYADYDDVFKVVLARVQSGTASILTADKDLGIITTDWIQDSGVLSQALLGGARTRTNFNIMRMQDGSGMTMLKVNMAYQTRSGAFGGWQEQPFTEDMARKTISPIFEVIQDDLERIGATKN